MSNAFRPLPFVLRQTFCLTLFSSLFLIQSFQHPLCIVVPTKPICLIWFVKPFDLPCNIVLFFFNILFLPLSAILPSPFRPFCNVFCLCSPRFQQRCFACYFFLPAFVISSAMVFACARCVFHTFICLHLPYFPQRCFFLFFFVTLIAVFYTCVLIVFCFLQRCFAIFDFLFSKIKKSLEILTKTFDIA